MPAPSVQQVRDTIKTLLQRNPGAGKKKLVRLLNEENKWIVTTKDFHRHVQALEHEDEPPAQDVLHETIKTLRSQNPTMGQKKFTNVLNTTHGWSIPTKEVRECLVAVDGELAGEGSDVV
jgi:hypothetical protein